MTDNLLPILCLGLDRSEAWDELAFFSQIRKQNGSTKNEHMIVTCNCEQTKCIASHMRFNSRGNVRIATPIIASNVITKHEKSSSGGEYMKGVCDCVYWECISEVYELMWKWRNMTDSWDECYVCREVYTGLSIQLGTRAGDNIWPTIYCHNQTLLANYELLLEI